MEECPVHNNNDNNALAQRIACILTYAGSLRDIYINYATLLLVCMVAVARIRMRCWTMSQTTTTTTTLTGQSSSWRCCVASSLFAALLVAVFVFQIVLCCLLGCAGISIVWCAVTGWLVHETTRQQQQQNAALASQTTLHNWQDAVLTTVAAVLVYYGATAPWITTVAHACALLLGSLLSRVTDRWIWGRSRAYQPVVDDTPSQQQQQAATIIRVTTNMAGS